MIGMTLSETIPSASPSNKGETLVLGCASSSDFVALSSRPLC